MKKYTAITIGPIYKTMQLARSTKAVWSASYMFSYIMRKLLIHVQTQGDLEIILPFSDDVVNIVRFDNDKNPIIPKGGILPVGLFPDHLLIKGKWQKKDFKKCRDEIIKKITSKFVEDLQDLDKYKNLNKSTLEKRVGDFLTHHIQIRRVCVKLGKKDNHVFRLNELCDSAELFNLINPFANETFLVDFFEKYKAEDKKAEYNELVRSSFSSKGGNDSRPFKSTAEIATAEFEDENCYKDASKKHILGNKDKTKDEIGYDEQNAFYNDIKKGAGNRFKFYHRYIVVVQADGDGVGALIKKIYETDSSKIEAFSKSLLAFSVEATQEILKYKGSPVYAGGDDLLFFAPVAHTDNSGKTSKNILDLIKAIDKVFKEQVLDNKDLLDVIDKLNTKPSMSYGINISYFKHPLDQALQNSIHLLSEKAKQGGKNAIALRVTKHSGQVLETTISKDKTDVIAEIDKLFKKLDIDNNFISNFMYKLSPLSSVIYNIGKLSDETQRNKRFDAFFENYFDEDEHKNSLEQGFLKEIKTFVKTIYHKNALTSFKHDIETFDYSNKGVLAESIFADCPLVDSDKYKAQIDNETEEEKIKQMVKDIYQDNQHQHNINMLYTILRFYQFINAKSE